MFQSAGRGPQQGLQQQQYTSGAGSITLLNTSADNMTVRESCSFNPVLQAQLYCRSRCTAGPAVLPAQLYCRPRYTAGLGHATQPRSRYDINITTAAPSCKPCTSLPPLLAAWRGSHRPQIQAVLHYKQCSANRVATEAQSVEKQHDRTLI